MPAIFPPISYRIHDAPSVARSGVSWFSRMPHLEFYEASLRALRYLEVRSPTRRRFGADADAMWRNFQGHLTAADRIDLLLRDADVEYAGAFSTRLTFALRGISEDDTFGPQWERLAPADADSLWRRVVGDTPPADVGSAINSCASAWGCKLVAIEIPKLAANTKVAVVGPSAIASLAARFAQDGDLSWADQVTCVATPHAHRHLATMCGALLGSAKGNTKATRLHLADAVPDGLFDRVIVSEDAELGDRSAVDQRKH